MNENEISIDGFGILLEEITKIRQELEIISDELRPIESIQEDVCTEQVLTPAPPADISLDYPLSDDDAPFSYDVTPF